MTGKWRKPRAGVAWLLVGAGVAGCAGLDNAPGQPPLDGTRWQLLSVQGWSGTGADAVTLHVDDMRASGSDGCNRYIAPFTANGAALQFTRGPASTMMACPPDVQARADAYLRALAAVQRYRMGGGPGDSARLELLDARGQVLATLAAQSAPSLAGTSWEVTAVHNGRGAVVGLVDGTRVVLSFDDQGRVSGSTGCNRFSTRYVRTPGGLQMEPPSTTRMACPMPGVMDQEQAVLQALAAVRSARFEGRTVELRDAGGALQIAAQMRAATP